MKTVALKVAEFADVYSGGTPSTRNPNYWNGEVAWITPKDMSSHTGIYIEDGERYITEQGINESSACLLPSDTVILSSRAPIGYVAVARGPLSTNQGCKNLRCKEGIAHPVFVYYLLKSNTATLEAHATGSTYKELSASRLKNITFRLPEVDVQARIASILSAYDDLIENNRRRIQLLEQAARLLYREWFVYFRFPGHEHVKITDGVPEGWEMKPFSELATFLNGFAFKPAHLGDVGLPIVKIPELRDGPTVKTPRNTGEHIPEKYLLDNGDILFSWSGTLLVNIWNHGKGLLNQHLFKVTPVSANLRGLVYFALKQALIEFQNQTRGATMKHIRKGALEKVTPLIPNAILLDEFKAIVAPMLEQISILQRQTTEAVKARDLLLPRLMNGEVAV